MVKVKLKEKPQNVKVVVRCRPLGKTEVDKYEMCASVDESRGTVTVEKPDTDRDEPVKVFSFDAAYGIKSQQKDVYDKTCSVIVQSVLQGYNGTVFAYGQTGAGKTFTMEGEKGLEGITPRSFEHIFDHIHAATSNVQFLVRASYLEILNENIKDLLAKNQDSPLKLKEHPDRGVFVQDLSTFVVKGKGEIDKIMNVGKKNRTTAPTKMNASSSRSHSIFTVTVECGDTGPDGKDRIRVGKLNLVDLAGSERQSKTGTESEMIKQAAAINRSLSALGNVINALVDGRDGHVPYRDSKLTRLLQDSLGGNTKTVMIANIGPATYNFEETISTLRYASRAKNIKNKPVVNEDPKDAMLRQFQEEISRLKQQLESAAQAAPSADQIKEVEKQVRAETMEEQEKLKEELQKKEEAQEAEAREREAMNKQLKALSMQVLEGVKNADVARQKERELEIARQSLEEKKRKELQMKEELEMREEKFISAQEEIEDKSGKLQKLWQHLKSAKAEIKDLNTEFQVEREDMNETIRQSEQEVKKLMLIIKNFIPPDEVKKLESRATWDDELQEWHIAKLQLAGNNVRSQRPISAAGVRRPMTKFSEEARRVNKDPRYRRENVIDLDQESSDRTTQDYGSAVKNGEEGGEDNNNQVFFTGGESEAELMYEFSGRPPRRPGSRRPESKHGRRGDSRRRNRGSISESEKKKQQAYPSARGKVQNRRSFL